jgi:hypothetical protein
MPQSSGLKSKQNKMDGCSSKIWADFHLTKWQCISEGRTLHRNLLIPG